MPLEYRIWEASHTIHKTAENNKSRHLVWCDSILNTLDNNKNSMITCMGVLTCTLLKNSALLTSLYKQMFLKTMEEKFLNNVLIFYPHRFCKCTCGHACTNTQSYIQVWEKTNGSLGTVLYRNKVARHLNDNGSGGDDDEYINRAHDPYIQCVHILKMNAWLHWIARCTDGYKYCTER